VTASGRPPEADEAWIGLGTNLGDRAAHLTAALKAFGTSVTVVSPVVETEPWGIRDQPWFLNAVARIRWTRGADALLRRCLEIEKQLGRHREQKNGPRVIDLDVLMVRDLELELPGLRVPHPGIAERRSVLEPWAAVAPDLLVPGLDAPLAVLRARAETLPDQGTRPWLAPLPLGPLGALGGPGTIGGDMARIVVLFGKKPERIIDLDVEELSIGRGTDVMLDLDNDLISRTHCQLRLVGDGYVVEDLRSKTGTYVNKERVTAHILNDGDRIGVGPWTLLYQAPRVDKTAQKEADLDDFWAAAAADSGMIETVLPEEDTGEIQTDFAGLPRAAASNLRPDVPSPGESMSDYKGTMLASADEMDRIRKSLEVSQEPHLTVRVNGRVEKLKLEDVTFEVGYFDDADYRLPGNKLFGKSQFLLRELGEGVWQVERGSFFAKVKVGGKPLKSVKPLKNGAVIAAAGLKFRFKTGA